MNNSQITLHLSERPVMKWTHHERVHVCGYAFLDEVRLEGRAFAEQVGRYAGQQQWDTLLQKMNGFFAIVYHDENQLFAATDRIRSIPLFYAENEGRVYLSDRAEWIRSECGFTTMDHCSSAEYLVTGFVTGGNTLFPELHQLKAGTYLQAGHSVRDNDRHFKTNRYFEFLRDSINRDTEAQKIEQLHATHRSVFERLVETLEGRRAVIPLSGGFDSRLIAVMLEEIGYDNIQYISYGKPGNWESRISKEIAEHFDRPWFFIPESRTSWYDWFHSPERREYAAYSEQLSSYAHIQDFPVVWQLKKNSLVPDDSVFIPGHSGGLMSGSHVPSRFLSRSSVSGELLLNHILKKNYSGWNWQKSDVNYREPFRNKIDSLIDLPDHTSPNDAADRYENWIWQERQAKYIVPSVMVYEFWGYEWRIPLWDNDMMAFWLHISADERQGRALYKKYIEKKLKLPVIEANSPKLAKAWNRFNTFANPQYGRFNGNRSLLKALSIRVGDIANLDKIPFDFIPHWRPIQFQKMTSLCSLRYLDEIRSRTDSDIAPFE
ncbi:MAG: hypothetical protein R3281_02640 [Balneolaceae bacterium]|nr:hypothetical protein [Balneolaceae bacterium]